MSEQTMDSETTNKSASDAEPKRSRKPWAIDARVLFYVPDKIIKCDTGRQPMVPKFSRALRTLFGKPNMLIGNYLLQRCAVLRTISGLCPHISERLTVGPQKTRGSLSQRCQVRHLRRRAARS